MQWKEMQWKEMQWKEMQWKETQWMEVQCNSTLPNSTLPNPTLHIPAHSSPPFLLTIDHESIDCGVPCPRQPPVGPPPVREDADRGWFKAAGFLRGGEGGESLRKSKGRKALIDSLADCRIPFTAIHRWAFFLSFFLSFFPVPHPYLRVVAPEVLVVQDESSEEPGGLIERGGCDASLAGLDST